MSKLRRGECHAGMGAERGDGMSKRVAWEQRGPWGPTWVISPETRGET